MSSTPIQKDMMSLLGKDNQLRHKFADEEGLTGGVQSLAVYKIRLPELQAKPLKLLNKQFKDECIH
jgi:hypothetical protein